MNKKYGNFRTKNIGWWGDSLINFVQTRFRIGWETTGTREYVLELSSKISHESTAPSASWYISEDHYRRLYHAIKREADFERVKDFLFRVESEEDASKVEDILADLSTR